MKMQFRVQFESILNLFEMGFSTDIWEKVIIGLYLVKHVHLFNDIRR